MSARIKVSRAGIELIKAFEGFRRRAARLPDGRWTLGYGHTVSAREGAEVSEADAEILLIFDLLPVVKAVETLVTTPLNQNQFDALVAFAFNVGVDAFRDSSVLARVNDGRLTEAAMAVEGWRETTLDGRPVVLDPLVRRRAAEKALFLTPPDGPFATPTALIRPALDRRYEATVPSRGLADVEIPFDGPVAGVRVIAMPEPDPELQPQPVSEPEPQPEPVLQVEGEPALETAGSARSEAASASPSEPVAAPSPGAAPAPTANPAATEEAPRPASLERTAPAMRAFLYAPYAHIATGPLPLARPQPATPPAAPAPAPAATVAVAADPAPAALEPAPAEPVPAAPPFVPIAVPTSAAPPPGPAPVISPPLNLPPRPAEPRALAPQPQPTSPPPTVVVAPPPPPRAAEPLVLTPPPEQDVTPGPFGPLREPEPPAVEDEPVLFEADAVRVVRHEIVDDHGDEPESRPDPSGRWVLLAGIGIVAWAGAMAAFLRKDDYSGPAVLAPETVTWLLGIVGATCFSIAAYFLLKRLGGVRD